MIINSVYATNDVIQLIDTSVLKLYTTTLPKRTTPQRNAMTAVWGINEKGRLWFNTTTKQAEMWNGFGLVILG